MFILIIIIALCVIGHLDSKGVMPDFKKMVDEHNEKYNKK